MLSDLVDPAVDGVVEDAGDEQALHVRALDVQLARDELDLDPRVRLDQLDQHLRSNWQSEKEINPKLNKLLHIKTKQCCPL